MKNERTLRYAVIAVILVLGVLWSFGSAADKGPAYPNADYLVDARWLMTHKDDPGLVIADVRSDEHFDGQLIPGAVRLDWSQFRYNDLGRDLASTFVGVQAAQEILGRHGITRDDRVVLYDSVERDGGATASYVFWVLDILGHEKMAILDRGIDAWKAAGHDLATQPREPSPLHYQALSAEVRPHLLIDGDFVYDRLGDPYYRIVDVRSEAEYRGEKGTKGLDGEPLKLGHIPTAVNIDYRSAWTDRESKKMRTYAGLQEVYRGLDPSRGTIVYCNSGRRSSFSYFVLRLMGFEDVYTYEPSWKAWGNPDRFYPVETRANRLPGDALPAASGGGRSGDARQAAKSETAPAKASSGDAPSGGYVSCGG